MRNYYLILFAALFSLPFITGPILAGSGSESDDPTYFADINGTCVRFLTMEPSPDGRSAFFSASSASTATGSPDRRTGDALRQSVANIALAEGESKPISFGPEDDDATAAEIAGGGLLDSEAEKNRVKQVLAILIEMHATLLHNPENQPFLLQTLKDLIVDFNFDANMLQKPWIMENEIISSYIPESSMQLSEKGYKSYKYSKDG